MAPYPLHSATDSDQDWRKEAGCAQVDGEIFFPSKGDSTRAAKIVCAHCPVRTICLDEALDKGWRDGIWGGQSPRERDMIRRHRRQLESVQSQAAHERGLIASEGAA